VNIFKGTVFEFNNNGESGSGLIVPQVYEQGTLTSSGVVSIPSGFSKIATVTLNTIGFNEGTYYLTLNTRNGVTKYTTTTGEYFPTLIDGGVTIAPFEARAWTNVPCFIQYDREVREIRIYWSSTPEISYVVYAAEKISGPWRKINESVATTDKSKFLDQPNLKSRFYRIEGLSGTSIKGMVWIPPGGFMMGSPDSEADRKSWEGPQTWVALTRGFWMNKCEVTQAEYVAVMSNNPSYYTGDLTRPVDRVTWEDATNYCGRLTEQEKRAGRLPAGYNYRLPTAAEWEYACRAGTSTTFSYGEDPGYTRLGEYAWYTLNSWYSAKPDGSSHESDGKYYTTHSVGQKLPNAWGLYDMYGNVCEWCLDWWSDSLPGGNVIDPKGPSYGISRISRGGGWFSNGIYCRSAFRGNAFSYPNYKDYFMGFRPVLAPVQSD